MRTIENGQLEYTIEEIEIPSGLLFFNVVTTTEWSDSDGTFDVDATKVHDAEVWIAEENMRTATTEECRGLAKFMNEHIGWCERMADLCAKDANLE